MKSTLDLSDEVVLAALDMYLNAVIFKASIKALSIRKNFDKSHSYICEIEITPEED